VFTLNTCSPIVGARVVSFEKEADMLNGEEGYVILAALACA